jgi:hypothetical protein
MPLLTVQPASNFFKTNYISGNVYIFQETFATAVTDNVPTGLDAQAVNLLAENDYSLFLISASAPLGATITFKKGAGATIGIPLVLTTTNPVANGDVTNHPLLPLKKGETWVVSASAAVPYLTYGIWVGI